VNSSSCPVYHPKSEKRLLSVARATRLVRLSSLSAAVLRPLLLLQERSGVQLRHAVLDTVV
jgi:hypothetical protein